MKPSLLSCTVLLLLAGCTALGPSYEEKTPGDVLSAASASPTDNARVVDLPSAQLDAWWERFHDPRLTRLMKRAFKASPTLEAARANLAAARAAWEYQRGALFPSVDVGGTLTRAHTSENGLSAASKRHYTDYQLSATARWELDLFGRNTFLMNAAEAQAESSEADLKALWVSISSNLATYYLNLRTLQGRLMVAEDNLQLQKDNYGLMSDRNRAGIANDLQKNQAEYDLRNTAATIPSLKAQIVATENAIALLCGVTPGTLPEDLIAPPPPPAEPDNAPAGSDASAQAKAEEKQEHHATGLRPTGIPQPEPLALEAGIPADALRRRPDVHSAERLLKASVDTLGAAKAERYPTVYISGTFGLDSLTLGDLLDWDSRFASFGPGVSLPIFRGGQIVANIKIKDEQSKAALANYVQTVLSALGDVRTALAGYKEESERLEQLRLGVQAAQNAFDIALNKYNAGLGDFFNVLDAQRQLQTLDEARVISEGTLAQQQVALYQALCGGWEDVEPFAETADAPSDAGQNEETKPSPAPQEQSAKSEPLLQPIATSEPANA